VKSGSGPLETGGTKIANNPPANPASFMRVRSRCPAPVAPSQVFSRGVGDFKSRSRKSLCPSKKRKADVIGLGLRLAVRVIS